MQQALILLEGMSEAGGEISPDVVSFNTCIKACGSANQLPQALQVPATLHCGVLSSADCRIHVPWCLKIGLRKACSTAFQSPPFPYTHWHRFFAMLAS